MQIFIDSANPQEVEEALKTGTVSGVVIDLKLISLETVMDFQAFIDPILALIQKHKPDAHLDIGGVFFQEPGRMLEFARQIKKIVKREHLSVQIPIGFRESVIISELRKNKIPVNCVACMTINQGIFAALTGAKYVSFFWNHIRHSYAEEAGTGVRIFDKEINRAFEKQSLDAFDCDPEKVVGAPHHLFNLHKLPTKIIVCSIGSLVDARDAFLAGADIVVMPPALLEEMPDHFMTEEVIDQFRALRRKRKSDDSS